MASVTESWARPLSGMSGNVRTAVAVAAVTKDDKFIGYKTVRIRVAPSETHSELWARMEAFIKNWENLYNSVIGFVTDLKIV